jgi:hypothetical protein
MFALLGVVCFLRQRCASGGRFPCVLALGSHLILPISTTSGEMVRAGDCIADHVLSTTRRRMSRRWRRTMLAATISEQPPQLRPIECYLSVPLGIDQIFAWRPLCFLQTTLARLCYMLIARSVELMRDRQIEGLPGELVAPVRLLLEKNARPPFQPSLTPTSPKQHEHCSCTKGALIRLMQPRVFEILPFLPQSPLLPLVLPASSFALAP